MSLLWLELTWRGYYPAVGRERRCSIQGFVFLQERLDQTRPDLDLDLDGTGLERTGKD